MLITNIANIANNAPKLASGHALTAPQDASVHQKAALKTRQLAAVTPARELSGDKALAEAVKKINDFIAPALQSVEFAIDQESGRLVVKVVDTATQKVLRQMPSEVALNIAGTLDDVKGLIVSLEA